MKNARITREGDNIYFTSEGSNLIQYKCEVTELENKWNAWKEQSEEETCSLTELLRFKVEDE